MVKKLEEDEQQLISRVKKAQVRPGRNSWIALCERAFKNASLRS